MQLVLTEDQDLIAKTARDFLAEKAPLSRTRELRDAPGGLGYGADLWKEMAELGWAGIPFAEEVLGQTFRPEDIVDPAPELRAPPSVRDAKSLRSTTATSPSAARRTTRPSPPPTRPPRH